MTLARPNSPPPPRRFAGTAHYRSATTLPKAILAPAHSSASLSPCANPPLAIAPAHLSPSPTAHYNPAHRFPLAPTPALNPKQSPLKSQPRKV